MTVKQSFEPLSTRLSLATPCLIVYESLAYRLKQTRSSAYSFCVCWISGHDDTDIEEHVDGQAKLAAGGDSDTSHVHDLPKCLCARPRVSLFTALQGYAKQPDARLKAECRYRCAVSAVNTGLPINTGPRGRLSADTCLSGRTALFYL